jgi:hypothetical protein
MSRRKAAGKANAHLGDAWALGRRYRRLSHRIRKPIATAVVMAVLVALTGPAAFAEDPVADPTTAATTTESPSPAPEPSPSPVADTVPADPIPAPSPEPSSAPSEESPSASPSPEASPAPSLSPDSPAPNASATISSDKDDYPPGGAVILTGANWQPGEIVHIRVNDDQGETWRRDADVIADGSGSIRDEFRLPDWFVAVYTVTATGPVSGTAATTFTDANVTAATLSIRTSATTTTCSGTTATSFTSGDRACARSTITNLSNNNPGQTGDIFVFWVNPAGTVVGSAIQHSGAAGATFDDTLIVNATGTWTVKVCTNGTCGNANQVLTSRTFVVNAATVANTSTSASNATATYGEVSVTLSAVVSPNTVNVGTVTFTVKSGSTTIGTATSGTVSGGAASANFSLSGVNGGTYTIEAAYSGGTGFNPSNNSTQSPAPTLTIDKADASCSITGYFGEYDAAAHGASGSCAGVNGEDAGTLDLGASFTDVPGGTADWSFTGNGNYNDQDGSVEIVITEADADCVVTGYDVTYDAAAHTATGSCTGVEDETLSGLDLSGTTHTAAGPYPADPWTFTDTTGNYNDQNGTVDDNIDKADASCSITGYSVVYDGAAHTATGSCTGVGGGALSGLNLSGTTHSAPGDYPADPWTFTAPNGNYNNASGRVHDNIHYAIGGTCLDSPGHQILQPIDVDGSSMFKQGSTVPAKFRVCDASGHSIGTPGLVSSFRLVYTTNGTSGPVDEPVVSATPDTEFRWSSSDQQWIFNMNTRNLVKNKTYFYRITLNDGSKIEFSFGLK